MWVKGKEGGWRREKLILAYALQRNEDTQFSIDRHTMLCCAVLCCVMLDSYGIASAYDIYKCVKTSI